MKRAICLWMILALALAAAGFGLAEDAFIQPAEGIEEPAQSAPDARYEALWEGSSGDGAVYDLLDRANDEAADIARYGAVRVREHVPHDPTRPPAQVDISIQNSDFGPVMIAIVDDGEGAMWMYTFGEISYSVVDGEIVAKSSAYTREQFDFYTASYHFPYGALYAMNGLRTGENGCHYMLVKSAGQRSFEYVIEDGSFRVAQLRVYDLDDNVVLQLTSWADYGVGPALEIPQAILEDLAQTSGNE